jgi:hypothetical protein
MGAYCGASLCVIKKPRGRGGHSPRWAAEPEKIKQCINIDTIMYPANLYAVVFYMHYCLP